MRKIFSCNAELRCNVYINVKYIFYRYTYGKYFLAEPLRLSNRE